MSDIFRISSIHLISRVYHYMSSSYLNHELWGLRRDLNPPRAVSSKISKLSTLILTTAAYTHQAILRRPTTNSKTTTIYNC